MAQQGPECVAAAAPAPAPAPVATPAPAPAPAPAPVASDAAPVPMDQAPVPMDQAPVAIDAATASAPPPSSEGIYIRKTQAEKEEEALQRSLWVLGIDFLIDMSAGRFGLRIRTDIPLYHGHWVPQLGFGASVLPPSFMAGTNNTAWAIPFEATLGMRIPLITPSPVVHLVPRAGAVWTLLIDRNVGFAFKILLGLGARLNFGSSFGINLGFDALIPAIGPGFVWLTTVGFSA
jgi:hypothetical protein